MQKAQWHLIAYDITDPKRLTKVHRRLSKQALPLQKSLFLLLASEKQIQTLLDQLAKLINPKTDDIRTYPIDNAQTIWVYGKSLTPNLIIQPKNDISPWQQTKKWLKQRTNAQDLQHALTPPQANAP